MTMMITETIIDIDICSSLFLYFNSMCYIYMNSLYREEINLTPSPLGLIHHFIYKTFNICRVYVSKNKINNL